MNHPADRQASIARDARHAAGYGGSARCTMPLRLRTIGRLGLKPGDVALDVGAGTGPSFPPLREAVGEGGRVQPWCDDFRWGSTQCGMGDVAQGRLRQAPHIEVHGLAS